MSIIDILFSAGGRCFLLAGCLLVSGCHAPQWRVFQSKVPEPLQKPAIQSEAERQSADWLAKTVSAPPEAVPVAQKLAASLGEPERPIIAKTPANGRDDALEALANGVRTQQAELSKLNAKLSKYDGSKIEGTGFNMFGVGVSLPVVGLIAFLILCPSVSIPFLVSTLKRVRGALVSTVEGIQNFKAENPDA